ncbi:unnamed protein product [Ranitomeya imitator]|uniref:Uncharacterized protein n=1 Tax=Ranitomeya imitator TaxID=111125 RepID=A0ABN9MPL0_9NEOB|nr:unnamed protein product [Ranitomeya imitator]
MRSAALTGGAAPIAAGCQLPIAADIRHYVPGAVTDRPRHINPRHTAIKDDRDVPVEFCRYIVGSILSEGDEKPLPDHLATTRVHPALEKYVKERKLSAHPYVELYKGDKIIFMCPLSRQDDFYVPEMKELLRKERGEAPLPEAEGAELDPLLEDTLSLELVSENQEETEAEGPQRKEQTDSEKSPSESGASASSFEDLDLDANAAAAAKLNRAQKENGVKCRRAGKKKERRNDGQIGSNESS